MTRGKITWAVGILIVLNIVGVMLDGLGMPRLRVNTDVIITLSLLTLFYFYGRGKIANFIKFYIIALALVGLLFIGDNFIVVLYKDVGTYTLMASVLLISNINLKKFSIGFQFLLTVIIAYYIYTMQFMDASLIQSAQSFERKEAFTALDRASSGLSSGLFIYKVQTLLNPILYAFIILLPLFQKYINKNILLITTLVSLSLMIIYALYYQKRQNFIEITFLLIVLFGLYNKVLPGIFKFSKLSSIVLGGVLIYLILNSDYFVNIYYRFGLEMNDVGDFSRFREFFEVSQDFSLINYFIGMGFGSFSARAYSAGANLHLGYFNLIFKGGILFLVFFISILIRNFIFLYRNRNINPLYLISFVFTAYSILVLSLSPGYGLYPGTFLIGLGLFSRYIISNLIHANKFVSQNTAGRQL